MKIMAVLLCALSSFASAFEFQAGFSKTDITPPLGVFMPGYYVDRRAKEILDPLSVVCVAFSDGQERALVMQLDTEALSDFVADEMRTAIFKATGVKREAIILHASHTHDGGFLGMKAPIGMQAKNVGGDGVPDSATALDETYRQLAVTRVVDAARFALADLKPAKLSFARTEAKRISFGRRYLMKDGKVRTNPGTGNPNVVRAVGNPPDEEVQLLRIDRVGGSPIAVINFQTHPDVVGGETITADWPGLTRTVFEAATFGKAHAIVINGTQGDVNHCNVMPRPGEMNGLKRDFDDVDRGYAHAQHMANVLASAALAKWLKCEAVPAGKIRFATQVVRVPSQRPKTQKEIDWAEDVWAKHVAGKDAQLPWKGMELTTEVARAGRIRRLKNGPDVFEIPLTSIVIGHSIAFGGFPGEPFNDIGKQVKKLSPFRLTILSCLSNGSRGYFPFSDSYKQGGYESATSPFGPSVADDLIVGELKLLKSLVVPHPVPSNATLHTQNGPLIQAHRGGRFEYDDNAAGGFVRSLARGLRGFELDVRFTKDRHLVVMHDGSVQRTTDGTGMVETLTLEEFKKCRLQACSERAPTLEEVLDTFQKRPDIFVELEMKVSPSAKGFYTPEVVTNYCQSLVQLVERKMVPGTYAFTCFSAGTLAIMRAVSARAPTGFIMGSLTDAHITQALDLGCCSVAPTLGSNQQVLDKAHAAGLTICLWMVQNAADYALARKKGADRVTSDYPHLLDLAVRGKHKKLVAMDLDATLCPHRSPIPPSNKEALKKLDKQYKCVMIGAGNAPRIYRQMENYPIDIVGNYGMQVAEAADGNFRIVKAITNVVDQAFFKRETDKLRAKYGYTKFEGDSLEFHASGMVTFGLLGTTPAAEHKLAFDPDRKKRRVMYPEVCQIFKDFAVYIGGSTSFDFAGLSYNKYDATLVWAKEHGYKLEDIVFIGDDFADGGGDSHIRIKDMDHIVIKDPKDFASAVSVLLK